MTLSILSWCRIGLEVKTEGLSVVLVADVAENYGVNRVRDEMEGAIGKDGIEAAGVGRTEAVFAVTCGRRVVGGRRKVGPADHIIIEAGGVARVVIVGQAQPGAIQAFVPQKERVRGAVGNVSDAHGGAKAQHARFFIIAAGVIAEST